MKIQYLHLLFVLLHFAVTLPELVASKKLLANNVNSVKNVTIVPSEKCDFPLISTILYKDQDSKDIDLEYLNSSSNLNVTKSFPYQYMMLTCSATYPIEWVWVIDAPPGPEVSKVDKSYYYAYILDDEIRSHNNKGVDHGTTKVDNGQYVKDWDYFIVRHHIGNDTLARDSFTNLTLTCQPVPDELQAQDSLHHNYMRPCGNALFLLRKRSSGPDKNSRNRTTLDIQFNAVARVNQENIDKSANAKSESCIKDEQWFSPKKNVTLVCSDYLKSPHLPSSTLLPGNVSLHDLQFNPAGLQEPFGVLQCAPKQGNNPSLSFHVPYYMSLPKLCPTEDPSLPHLYLRRNQSKNDTICSTTDLVNEEELLSICVHNIIPSATSIYVGDKITVTCISAIYYFAEGMKIEAINMTYDQETQKQISEAANAFISNTSQERSFGPGGYRNLTTIFEVNDTNIKELECKAPVRKSRKWITKGVPLDIKIPEKLAFDGFSEAVTATEGSAESFLLCNATGDPLPILSWSRLNNGKLPANQSTQIQSFPTSHNNGSQHGQHIPSELSPPTTTNTTTWISSKLYLPLNETELAEYFGRFICTAKNRFESIEKVFLFEKEEAILGFGQHAMMKSIGKTVWFWALVILAMFVLIGLVILLGLKVREKTGSMRFFTKAEIDEFVFGKPELLLYDSDNYEEINSYAAYLPYDRNQFEIRREQLEFDPKDILGSGAFGTVYKGIFIENGKRLPVAIKTVDSASDKMYFAALLSEIKVMCYIGTHENVVGLIGACTKYLDQRQIFVATEFCENGDMLSYIHKHRETFINNAGLEHVLTEDGNGVKSSSESGYIRLSYARLLLSPRLLLVWALQITKGMSFLSSRKVIHGDLAARNILLGTDLQPKIGDFGLSNQLQNYSNYVQKGYDLVPWKWLAIESLQFMKFSLKSDVWAFGVVLFEILTLGQVPYPNYTYSELFIAALCQGERLPKPLFATNKMYKLMLDCWMHAPEDRPTFMALENSLKILILENEMVAVSDISINSKGSIDKNDATTQREEIPTGGNDPEVHQLTSPNIKRFNSDASNLSTQTQTPLQPTPSYVIDWKAVI